MGLRPGYLEYCDDSWETGRSSLVETASRLVRADLTRSRADTDHQIASHWISSEAHVKVIGNCPNAFRKKNHRFIALKNAERVPLLRNRK